ncbi:FGGY-family carbohydrate kinase [uncultured Martelella sp.]|uniref:FGGY-family carbohydrate kinase n=1 Tax=uncultured Martelella sp. TaxID=392331 RepID=UPI0029C918DB|nr:FGGY-family carbohydrate kinase [uncultured Martelella sp.]
MRDHVIAVDVGTASVRAGIFDKTGTMLSRRVEPLRLRRPGARRGEYVSDDIWQTTAMAVRSARLASGLGPERIAGLAFGATCSLVLLDRAGDPLPLFTDDSGSYDTIAWFDHRARDEAAELSATGEAAVRHSGGSISPEMQVPKLLWLKRNRPELWQKAGDFFDLADFLSFRATGSRQRSLSTLATKWFHMAENADPWPRALFDRFSLGDLPEKAGAGIPPCPPGKAIGKLTEAAAEAFGLDCNVTVAAGMVDAYAGALGALPHPGMKAPGEFALIGGTSSCLIGYGPDPVFAGSVWGPYFSAIYPHQWPFEAGQSATGGLLNHLLEIHAEGGPATEARHEQVNARIASMIAADGPGFADGLDILPDFHGSRSPFADPAMTGMVAGLTLDKSFDGLCRLYWRACIAIALSLRQILEHLAENGIPATALHLAGGHRRNPLLSRLYADVTGRPVHVSPTEDVVLLGSAVNAAAASGLHAGLEQAATAMRTTGHTHNPDPALSDYYESQYVRLEILQACRDALRSVDPAAQRGQRKT